MDQLYVSWCFACINIQSLQSCPTLCDPMDYSPPGSSVLGIPQVRMLEWITMPSSRGSSRPRDGTCVSCIAGRILTAELPGKPQAGALNKLSFGEYWWVKHREPSTTDSDLPKTIISSAMLAMDLIDQVPLMHQKEKDKSLTITSKLNQSPAIFSKGYRVVSSSPLPSLAALFLSHRK